MEVLASSTLFPCGYLLAELDPEVLTAGHSARYQISVNSQSEQAGNLTFSTPHGALHSRDIVSGRLVKADFLGI